LVTFFAVRTLTDLYGYAYPWSRCLFPQTKTSDQPMCVNS
jgi:hypothetical protein